MHIYDLWFWFHTAPYSKLVNFVCRTIKQTRHVSQFILHSPNGSFHNQLPFLFFLNQHHHVNLHHCLINPSANAFSWDSQDHFPYDEPLIPLCNASSCRCNHYLFLSISHFRSLSYSGRYIDHFMILAPSVDIRPSAGCLVSFCIDIYMFHMW